VNRTCLRDISVWLYPWKREKDMTMYDQLENEDNFKSGAKYHDHNRTKCNDIASYLSRRSVANSISIDRYIRAFSLTTNMKRLLAPIPGGLEAFNGLRVLSIMWVILGHTYGQVVGLSLNSLFLVEVVLDRRFFQVSPFDSI